MGQSSNKLKCTELHRAAKSAAPAHPRDDGHPVHQPPPRRAVCHLQFFGGWHITSPSTCTGRLLSPGAAPRPCCSPAQSAHLPEAQHPIRVLPCVRSQTLLCSGSNLTVCCRAGLAHIAASWRCPQALLLAPPARSALLLLLHSQVTRFSVIQRKPAGPKSLLASTLIAQPSCRPTEADRGEAAWQPGRHPAFRSVAAGCKGTNNGSRGTE